MKILKFIISIFYITTLFSVNSVAQNRSTIDSSDFRNIMKTLPPFTIFGDNYIITGSTIGENPNRENPDIKIQLGFKQRLTNFAFPWNTYLFFTYRQKAFWNVYDESSPFREINYNPAFAIAKPLFRNGIIQGIILLQMEHESNGRDGEKSRSWNYPSLFCAIKFSPKVTGSVKIWVPLGNMEDNKDITDYKGFSQLQCSYQVGKRIILETEINKSFKLNWKGSVQLGFYYQIAKNSNQHLYAEYFLGYAEDLINYNRATQKIRVGISFRDLFRTLQHYK
ncbi:MAG: phospholipase A [Salinivirgaceae bacterium]|nr:phospholipase A [Salinivirgaceae bacterium]